MVKNEKCAVGDKVRVEGVGCDTLFLGRVGVLLGYTRGGWARVRLEDASPWESLLAAEEDEDTGAPIILLYPDCLRKV